MLPRFPAAFRPPAFASWASFPARGFRPPYGRPTTPPAAAGTRTGFPCSARVRPGWLRVPSLPRGRRCPHGRMISPAAACRIATASPCHPGPRPAPGCISDEASARVHCHSPHTSLPLACDPGRNGILGLFPELRTRPGRTRQRTPERGQARTLPGLRRWHQPASFRRTHSPRATSRRTISLLWARLSAVLSWDSRSGGPSWGCRALQGACSSTSWTSALASVVLCRASSVKKCATWPVARCARNVSVSA